jgi:hypothetical protein
MTPEFEREADMAPIVASWLRGRGFQVALEFQTDQGIADMVACSWSARNVRARLSSQGQLRVSSRLALSIWLAIPTDETVALDALIALHNDVCDRSQVEQELFWLERRGLVAHKSDRYCRPIPWWPLHRQLVAIELKLSRIRDAVHQAGRYLEFADCSYVALPWNTAHAAACDRRARLLEERGLGLLAVGPRRARPLIPPRQTESGILNPVSQSHVVERLLARSRRSSASTA